jgi:4-cresol dehydrogenase (hydroxylating)
LKKHDESSPTAHSAMNFERRRLLKGSLAGGSAAIAGPMLAGLAGAAAADGVKDLNPGPLHPEFRRALEKLHRLLGDEGVVADGSGLEAFQDPYYHDRERQFAPSAAVFPAGVEDIRAILNVAREHRIPLWASSAGRNLGYGGGAPRLNGTLVLNLRRMNRVIEINEESGYAVVEPGVSFFDLYEALGRQTGHRWWMSVPDIGWGSVIGNTLEHGRGYTPFGEHADTQCGMEVVLADGDIVRTGMGALTNSRTWHLNPRGFGPRIDTLFMQSNFGIVTKMGVWLMPRPEFFVSGNIDVRRDGDLAALIDAVRPLMIDRTIHNFPIVGNILGYASFVSTRAQWHQGTGPVPEAVLQQISDETGIGRWSMRFALYGLEAVVDAHLARIGKAVSGIPGANVTTRRYRGDAPPGDIHPADKSQAGIPGMEIMSLTGWYGGRGGHLGFSPITPLIGREVAEQTRLARRIAEKHGHDYLCGIILGPRSATHVCEFIFDTDDRDLTRRAYEASRELIVETAKRGYGEYRAHLDMMDLVASQYDFNGHALRRFNERLKDALDPDGILSPGKQGIWPRAMRNRNA